MTVQNRTRHVKLLILLTNSLAIALLVEAYDHQDLQIFTAADFFLWCYLKEKAYRNKPQTLEELRVNIEEYIKPQTLKKSFKNHSKKGGNMYSWIWWPLPAFNLEIKVKEILVIK